MDEAFHSEVDLHIQASLIVLHLHSGVCIANKTILAPTCCKFETHSCCAPQAKQLDPDFGLDVEDDDGWDDALGYLEACGPGVQHQIARTTSLERTLTSSSLLSNGSEASQFLVDDSHKDKVLFSSKTKHRRVPTACVCCVIFNEELLPAQHIQNYSMQCAIYPCRSCVSKH